ncbi:TetR family transcriptional regulator [Aeromicrobium terrae]|jgi:AcrR family transcriptional regulator|uniref:TetR/AcrR family transcriptional regulator n=1 Tax=Aeromicrobium terrae TaxID=2498846 RepID=A0A5C8NIP5_9ACTN|nr:TetR family transcriptional regulator [Aeromicrobium terrae]TXL60897.1 TetR/AcrR family transcriptional regulator [Aeromicrobium terrae]
MTSVTETPGSNAQRERRRRILDATIALANEGGFDAVQMREVADNADVALGTLYRYFPSKVHLLVTALGRQFERAEAQAQGRPVPGDTPHERVMHVLGVTTKAMQKQPQLTEALTRAFMFADASVSEEIHYVGMKLTAIITHAIEGTDQTREPTEEDTAIVRVIGDVWLSALMGWVTGRTTADEVERSMDVAVRLLLR